MFNNWYLITAIKIAVAGVILFLIDPNTGRITNITSTEVYVCTKTKPVVCKDENGVKGQLIFIPEQ